MSSHATADDTASIESFVRDATGSGEIAMTPDDWRRYGPEIVTRLLLAQRRRSAASAGAALETEPADIPMSPHLAATLAKYPDVERRLRGGNHV